MTLLSRPPLTYAASFIGSPCRLVEMGVDALQEANAHLLGVQSQHVAYRLKREWRTLFARPNPPFGLAKELTPVVVASATVLVEARRGVEQHRPQQPALAQRQSEAATGIDLSGKQNLRERFESLGGSDCVAFELHGSPC
jgi:hypothetical protein